MRTLYILALGSNLGDRAALLQSAVAAIAGLPGSTLRALSQVAETTPLGGLDQPRYLNQMVAIDSELSPGELLAATQAIEAGHQRIRGMERWMSRTLDIDIVWAENYQLDSEELRLPHPGLYDREFWQRGITELNIPGDMIERIIGCRAGDDS